MKFFSRRLVLGAFGALAAMTSSGLCAQALKSDDWPTASITIIVPYAAGGSADRVARNLAPFFEKELKTRIIVDNRPGASGQIGVEAFLRRPADANTLLLNAQPNHSTAIVIQKAPYSIDDFEVINVHEFGNASITVLADSPYKTFDDLHKAIKANPGKVSLATPRGGGLHMMGLLLKERLGWDVIIVTYNSGEPVRTNLLGGHVTFSINGAVSDAELKPRVRSLALSTPSRLSAWPEAPFINDALKAYNVEIPTVGDIRFLAFRKGTRSQYPNRVEKFVNAYQKIMKDPDFVALTKKIGSAEETAYRGAEQSARITDDMHRLLVQYQDKFKEQ